MTSTKQSPGMLRKSIEELISRHRTTLATGADNNERRVSDEELARIAKSFSVDQGPSPDEVPNMVLKVTVAEAPAMFRFAMQKCLVWKRQSRVILPRAAKPGEDP